MRIAAHGSRLLALAGVFVGSIAAVLAGSIASAQPLSVRTETPAGQGRARLTPCPPSPSAPSSTAMCGSVSVLENRAARRGRRIDLHVIVIPGIGGSTRPPLFFLEGGPGLAASDGAGIWETELKAYREKRDIVLLDQRGTGLSNPLRCEKPRRNAADLLDEMYPVEYVRRCRAELEPRADLTRYTTPDAAADLEEVRRALGYARIDLMGLSYGTRLALVYMRMHPRSVRAAVLIGVTPTWARLPLFHSANARRALLLLFQDCAAEAACAAAYPDLAADLASVSETLGRAPASVNAVWPPGTAATAVTIGRDVFMETLRRAMYAPSSSRRVPAVIHAAAHGDFEPFLKIALPTGDGRAGDADGLYLSITCSEDTSRITPEQAARETAGNVFGRYRIDQQTRACASWPTTAMPPRYDHDVRSSAPVLILSGGRDPVTPPQWAARVARKLSRSLHVVVPLSAHLEDGLDDPECWDRVILSFLDRGTAEGLDTSCLARLKPGPFDH